MFLGFGCWIKKHFFNLGLRKSIIFAAPFETGFEDFRWRDLGIKFIERLD